MVGQLTLRLENLQFDIAKCTIVLLLLSDNIHYLITFKTAGLIFGSNFVRDSDRDCVSYLDIPLYLSMQPNCEQIRQI